MIQTEKVIQIAKEIGFQTAVPLNMKTLKMNPEVRKMCETNKCHQYHKNWSCPPGCGTLEACQVEVSKYEAGVLLQTVGEIEDSFDFEAMEALEKKHTQYFVVLVEKMRKMDAHLLPLNVGCCANCQECTYPNEVCRLPEKAYSSVEAYGLLVSDLCKENRVKYYYGSDKIAYTACVLF